MNEEIIVNGPMDSFDILLIAWQVIVFLFYMTILYFGIRIYRKLNKYLDMRMKYLEEDEGNK